MEEVGKDISLSSLNGISLQGKHGTLISTAATNPAFPSMILQDFLATPFNNIPPTTSSGVLSNEEPTFLHSLSLTPATVLRLNIGSDPLRSNPAVNNRTAIAPSSLCAAHNSTFQGFGSSARVFLSFCRKRAQGNNENPDDLRLKLMMKNRESAAQSRARKQAYKKELEREVAHLKEENANLRKHQKKVMAAINQLPKKNRLSRSLTTPF
ncbi:hypothetical protein ES332_D05G288300v1 [Gossypium tomentosum]|uniref:BZIP domain-containing protein n=1 Tax=Gossypium tomentosum TaxID=34277 RepID=A0A5D2L1A8_GOSTO|nr:hypothetical protein ES332_D05G288300v1 [Gossypium tomentosum]